MKISNKKTILIIEDNLLSLDVHVGVLGDKYDIKVATSGQTGIYIAQKFKPDLILLDIILPDIDGYEVCKKLKVLKATKDIPIIFLSALSDIEDQSKGLSLGASDYITKPSNPELMLARIKIHLELKTRRESLDEQVEKRTKELESTKSALIASMAILAEFRDCDTGDHIARTMHYVDALCRNLKGDFPGYLKDERIELIKESAQLHDIGKVAIPDSILLKKGPLTHSELKVMRTHPILGAKVIERTEKILGNSSFLTLAREIVEFHHERWDGSGYPYGLKGEEIPLCAQIMSIADIYDALVSDRPYKPAFSHEKAVSCILEGDARTKPEHFSPQIIRGFIKSHEEFKKISEENTTFDIAERR